MATIGIDFGTTNSVISFFEKDTPIIIPNLRGQRLTPSIVSIDDNGKIFVGESAKNQILYNIHGTITEVKRKIGSNHIYNIHGSDYTPTEIASFIFADLKNSAQNYLGSDVDKAIITVPAHFLESQRLEIKNAATMAGLEVIRMINEPTAAALSYTYISKEDKNFIVYDLGGGTFDVSILNKSGNNFTVKATCGDSNLGGKDIDLMLYKLISSSFEKENNINLKDNLIIQRQLLDSIENAKKELSMSNEVNITVPFLTSEKKSLHLNYKLTRIEFNNLIIGFINKSMNLLDKALKDAKLNKDDIGGIIYSGGSSRIPLIHELIKEKFGFENTYKVNPDEIVSLGACVCVASQDNINDNIEGLSQSSVAIISFQDVSYYTIGIEADSNVYIPIIKRNSPLPITKKKIFTTVVDSQEEVEIHILQGESSVASENVSLSKFSLRGISIAPKGKPKIEVSFNIDKDGLTNISACDLDTGSKDGVSIVLQNMDNEQTKEEKDYEDAGGFEIKNEIIKINSLISQLEHLIKKNNIKDEFLIEYKEIVELIKKSKEEKDKEKLKECHESLEIFYNEIKEIILD